MKIGIVGSGISGLSAAWLLSHKHQVTVFEQDDRIGGHSNTVELPPYPAVDTGFIVYNEKTYPNLIALFDKLNVETDETDMSFGVSLDGGRLEYSSDALFVQKKNLFSLRYYRMIKDIMRFYKEAPKLLEAKDSTITLSQYLVQNNYSEGFIADHILPMAAAIWSMSVERSASFPAKSFIRFFANHGLLELNMSKRPKWHTVKGGSRNYVDKLTKPFIDNIHTNRKVSLIEPKDGGVTIQDEHGQSAHFDHVILATHTDQALDILGAHANADYDDVLGSIPYAPNIAYLHTDTSLMPKNKKAWASWCYLANTTAEKVSVSYWMNKLQPSLPKDQDLFVTLNPETPPREDKTIKKIKYQHPEYTLSALEGWNKIKTIQGQDNIWLCGAWCGYGFHEDGITAGLSVAEQIDPSNTRPWNSEDKSPAGMNAKAETKKIKT
jgi:predicted NAD/FAD-binding protein